MSFDVNGDRSPNPPDKPPQIKEISSRSALRLEQLNEGPLQSNDLFPEIMAPSTFVSTQKRSWEQLLEAERQTSAHEIAINEAIRLDSQSNQGNQSDLVFEQASVAAKSGQSSQNLGIRPQGINSVQASGGNLQWRPIPSGMLINQDVLRVCSGIYM